MSGGLKSLTILEDALDRVQKILADPLLAAAVKHEMIHNVTLSGRLEMLRQHLLRQFGPVVQGGPLAGMKLHSRSAEGCYVPKLLGCYESELHPVIADLKQRKRYSRIINIGCAEGYYAVGLARLFPRAEVLAFDIDENCRDYCGRMAQMNYIGDRVRVSGRLTPKALSGLIDGNVLIFCDIEGDEFELLDPEKVGERLDQADLIVELHDEMVDKQEQAREFFAKMQFAHDVSVIEHGGRDPRTVPSISSFSQLDIFLCSWEFRPCATPWGVFLSKAHADTVSGT